MNLYFQVSIDIKKTQNSQCISISIPEFLPFYPNQFNWTIFTRNGVHQTPKLLGTCCLSRRILLAAFLLSLSQAEAKILSATAEVRWEGIGRDYKKKKRERERETWKIINRPMQFSEELTGCAGVSIYFNWIYFDKKRKWKIQRWKMKAS